MKNYRLFLCVLFGLSISTTAHAANLLDVYQQALLNDQIFQQAISQRLASNEGVSISAASLLPSLGAAVTPSVKKTNISGQSASSSPNTQRGYTVDLTLTQTVFNFAQFTNLSTAFSLSKQADATLNAAAQSLMQRVAKAYFAVLQDEDNLRYLEASKKSYSKQLDQVTQQYNVGLKTITDVYTARSSFDSANASYIAAQNALANDRENLRVITGTYYPSLAKLDQNFPLISPVPHDIEAWVKTAEQQNWQIKSAQYAADAARKTIKQQFAGHLPTLQAQGNYDINYTRTIADQPTNAVVQTSGASRSTNYGASLILNIPLVQGGAVVAGTRQAQYNYQVSYHQLEQQIRTTINTTRQSYLGVESGISQIGADKQAIKSSVSSLKGMRAGYEVGTQTLVDVLTQQKQLFQAQQQYAADRYAYVNNLLSLKAAAGTLSQQDLEAINSWLISGNETADSDVIPEPKVALNHPVKKKQRHKHKKA